MKIQSRNQLQTLRNLLVFVGLFTTLLQGEELYYSTDHSVGFSDFLLGTRLVEDASYTDHGFAMSSVISDQFRTYVDLSHYQIYPYAEYSSSQGEVGLQARYLEIKDNQFFAGVFGTLRRYHSEYSYYNNSSLGVYFKWKYYFRATQLVTSGIDVNLKRYAELPEASNTEQQIYIKYNHSFKTRTSINVGTTLGQQDFWPQTTLEGQGVNLSTIEVDPIPSNLLFTSSLRLSQSLGAKLGLTLWLETQKLLNEAGGTLLPQDGLNNPFIDNYRWEGPSTSLRLIYRLNQNNSFTLSHSFVDKAFLDVPVYAFDFEASNYVLFEEAYVDLGFDRQDKRQSVQFSWKFAQLSSMSAWLAGTELILNVGRVENSSNDPIYDFGSSNYSLSINFNN